MAYTEEPVGFDCEGEPLVGVFTLPARASGMGVLIVVGGPQYRVGSHRQFVLLARRLADAGHAVLRFDFRGMGDSGGPQRPFESTAADIRAALDAFDRLHPQPRGYALWGLCDGASAALLHLDEKAHPRVKALCLVNPWVRGDDSLARTQLKHYYLQRLGQREFWSKLLRGGVDLASLRELGRKVRVGLGRAAAKDGAEPHYVARMARACLRFEGATAFALSDDDLTAREFDEVSRASPAWQQVLARPNVSRVEVEGADHTFSASAARRRLEEITLDLLARAAGAGV